MSKKIRIAIDGPAGAGKSSISQLVAEELKYRYIDTGALYRSVALLVLQSGGSPDKEETVRPVLSDFHIDFAVRDGVNRITVNGTDITDAIRTPDVSMAASTVSAIPFVREALFDIQRHFATQAGIVMEGRDIGTVIMPEAELKIFLVADEKIRAKRRIQQLKTAGKPTPSFEEMVAEVLRRDYQDTHREIAPLVKADDAVLLDNSHINLRQTADKIITLARAREQA